MYKRNTLRKKFEKLTICGNCRFLPSFSPRAFSSQVIYGETVFQGKVQTISPWQSKLVGKCSAFDNVLQESKLVYL